MKQNRIFRLLSASVILALMLSLFSTLPVFADDATPPAPTEEPAIPATEEPIATAVPVATEEPVVSLEEVSVEEVLAQVPTGTEVVVLNEEGQPEPLVSEEAAEVILTSDPMWCPAGQTPGGPGCTAGYATAAELITALNGVTGDGTIYFMPTYSTNDLTFDHTNVNISGLNALTIQGGWNGSTGNAFALSGSTTFTGGGLSITNWTSAVTINDISVQGAGGVGSGVGINVETTGDILLNDVQSHNSLAGASLENVTGNGSVTLNGTNSFNNNVDVGLGIFSNSDVTLNGTNTFNNNGYTGLDIRVFGDGDITANNITANENSYGNGAGLFLNYGSGSVAITGTNTFNNNSSRGLYVWANGDITLNNVTANNNLEGARLNNLAGNGSITLNGTNSFHNNLDGRAVAYTNGDVTLNGSNTFTGDDYIGLEIDAAGYVILNNVTANNNVYGVDVIAGGNVIVENSQFNENGVCLTDESTYENCYGEGLFVDSLGTITLNNVIADRNLNIGAYLEGETVFVNNSQFNGNGSTEWVTRSYADTDSAYDSSVHYGSGGGLYVEASSQITLNQVIANMNSYMGANLYSSGTINVNNSQFNENGSATSIYETGWHTDPDLGIIDYEYTADFEEGYGLRVDGWSSGSISLNQVTANGNSASGADIYGSNVTILNSQFNGNGSLSNSSYFETDNNLYTFNYTMTNEGGGGLFVGANMIYLENTQASNNYYSGAYLTIDPVTITVKCSAFNNNVGLDNFGRGLSIYLGGSGTANLFNVETTGNTTDLDIYGGTYTIETDDCNPDKKKSVDGPSLPWNLVTVNGGEQVDLDCTLYSGTALILPNGDRALLSCPLQGVGQLSHVEIDNLPSALPEGNTFKSALDLNVFNEGETQELVDNVITLAFVLPEGIDPESLAILFWDEQESKWVELSSLTFDDGRQVFDPGHVGEGGFFQAAVNFTGTFVLVQK